MDLQTLMAEENVLFGLENLKSYTAVQRALDAGNVRLHGWMFKIGNAQLFACNPDTGQFELLPQSETQDRPPPC
jgi:carbonic anhydrase